MSDDVIEVPILTRVEGEGGLTVRLKGDSVEDVRLRIYEPPRLFEALLRGRPLEDAPDVTARICGICPVAYQMSSVHALERALGVAVTPTIRRLRRLLYCGEWIESHALHIHLLHAPDFFDAASGIELAKCFPDEVNRGLQLKKYGNRLLEVLGGRAIHPINVRVGGFYRLPRRDELASLVPHFEWGVEAAAEAARWVAGFPFPDFDRPYEFVALSHPHEYAMNEGEIATSDGLRIPIERFEEEFAESQVPHSTALHSLRRGVSTYLVGPLARVSLNGDQLSPTAKALTDELGFGSPCHNPHRGIVARAIEVVHAYEEALSILTGDPAEGPAHVTYEPKAASGCAATEAPRGLLYHRYETNADGTLAGAKIVPPTSQNQAQIEADLRAWLEPRVAGTGHDILAAGCERLVRAYDPCISCSTHFLDVRWELAECPTGP
jgi:coenzyme F420-reducing hydrogenase alpha subunit